MTARREIGLPETAGGRRKIRPDKEGNMGISLSKLEAATWVVAICFVLFLLFGFNWIH